MATITRKVQGRILSSLSMFVMLFVVLAGVSLQQLHVSEEFRLTDEVIEQIDVNTLHLFKTDVDVYNFDLIHPGFYTDTTTVLLTRHDSLFTATSRLIQDVRNAREFLLEKDLSSVESSLRNYDQLFRKLVSKLREKGFKDFGLEGKVRTYAHALEDQKLIPTQEILSLRRHEKDYLLRDDRQYIDKLNALSDVLIAKYGKSRSAADLLNNYRNAFNELVRVSDEVGLHKETSLKAQLNNETSALLSALKRLNREGELQTAANHRKTFNMFILAIVFAVLFAGVLIYLTARSL